MPEILGNEIDFFGALRLELLRLPDEPGQRLGAVFPAHQRNRAERAGVIAALGDLEVTNVRLVAEELAHAGM